MAYIGNPPISGNFQVCDAISVVNGQAAYTMQVSSANVSPETANHMLVSLNGVLQKPGSSFTISGSTITFASNLATGDVIDFILLLGNVNDIGTPSDSTVTNAKTNFTTTSSAAGLQIKGDGTTAGALQLNCEQNSHGIKLQSPAHSANQSYTLKFPTGNVTADKVLKVASVSGSGTTGVGQLSFGDAGGTNTPSFQAYRTATQSLSNNVWTKIQNNVELFDTDGAYDHSTNYRFTIPSGKAGKYVILVAVNIHDLGDGKYVQSAIYKNGSVIKEDIVSAGRTIPTSVKTITIDDASVGDYYEAYVKNRNDSTRDLNYAYGNVFYGYKLIT
jgi:hypothetical protein